MLNMGSLAHQGRHLALPKRYVALFIFVAAYLGLFHLAPAMQHLYQPLPTGELLSPIHDAARHMRPTSGQTPLTINLVVASVASDDVSWTEELHNSIANLQIFRYVSDDPVAEYHPSIAKGREALMYFTYLYDHYDSLADVNIFIHAEEHPWHLDGAMQQSMRFALSQLDLEQVMQLHYFNLYTSLKGGRPEGYNTTKTTDETDVAEEPFIAEAMRANFGEDVAVPEMLIGPCCSQFAVSKEAIRSRPRSQYRHSMQWLTETDWPDQLTGRIWEHLWPWLFLHDQAVDRKTEWRTLCRMYRVCFSDSDDLQQYQAVWDERVKLLEKIGFGRELLRPWNVRKARMRLNDLLQLGRQLLLGALERGQDPEQRIVAGLDLTAP